MTASRRRVPYGLSMVGTGMLLAPLAGGSIVGIIRDRALWQVAAMIGGCTLLLIAALYDDIVTRAPKLRASGRIAVAAYALLVSLLLLDTAAQRVERRQARTPVSEVVTQLSGALIPDPVLERRALPNTFGADASGFRNAAVLRTTDLVAIGDSQTWGKNARASETWPSVLAGLSGRRVYSMATSGYGPAQYWSLTPQALTYEPETIIVGLYLGNDLWDAYHIVYTIPAFARFRLAPPASEFQRDPSVAASLAIVAGIDAHRSRWPRAQRVIRTFALGRLLLGAPASYVAADRAWASDEPALGAVAGQGAATTVLTPGLRLLALDLADPRIAEGARLTELFMQSIDQLVRQRGRHLLVVFIPTKESVYAASAGLPMTASHQRLVTMEAEVRRRIGGFLANQQIAYVDALPALQAAAQRGAALYPADSDGHPTAIGYAVIAQSVASTLSARNTTR